MYKRQEFCNQKRFVEPDMVSFDPPLFFRFCQCFFRKIRYKTHLQVDGLSLHIVRMNDEDVYKRQALAVFLILVYSDRFLFEVERHDPAFVVIACIPQPSQIHPVGFAVCLSLIHIYLTLEKLNSV